MFFDLKAISNLFLAFKLLKIVNKKTGGLVGILKESFKLNHLKTLSRIAEPLL
jgi:hypothetical protein